MHIYVLDTGVLLSQWTSKNPDFAFMTTQSVIDEIQNRPSKNRVQNLLSTDRLRIASPDVESIEITKKKARESGDYGVLSGTDLELISLSLQQKQLGRKVSVVSSDLALLNTAAALGLSTLDPKGRMKERITWMLKCPGCGNEESEMKSQVECPVCGTKMQRKPKRKEKIKGAK
ncbi:MAG: NOB1 family endonuclease [Candidatus Thorarchaeota archaeon]